MNLYSILLYNKNVGLKDKITPHSKKIDIEYFLQPLITPIKSKKERI